MALYANTNMDIPENKRPEKIKIIEEQYDMVIDAIHGKSLRDEKQDETPEQVAFMRAAQRGQAMVAPPVMPGEETIANLPE